MVDDVDRKEYFESLEEKRQFLVLSVNARFVRVMQEYVLRVPTEISCQKIESDLETTFILQNGKQQRAYVHLYKKEINIKHFEKVCFCSKSLTIGNRIDCDFYITDMSLEPTIVQIHHEEKQIVCENCKGMVYVNQERVRNTTYGYQEGDILQVGILLFILHHAYIMYNPNPFVLCSLSKAKMDVPSQTMLDWKPILMQNCIHPCLKFPILQLEDRKEMPSVRKEDRPMVYQIGRSITLSFGSLSIGAMMVYQNWMDGRSILQLLPMLMYPFIMIFSTVFWTILEHRYKVKNEKREIDNYVRYQSELIERQLQKYIEQVKETNEKIRLRFRCSNALLQISHCPQLECFDLYDDDFFSFYVGEIPFRTINPNGDIEDACYERIEHEIPMISFLMNVSLGECVWIQEKDPYAFSDTFLFRIICTHSPKYLRLVVITNQKDTTRFSKMPHLYDPRFGKMLYTKKDFLSDMQGNLDFIHAKIILLSYEGRMMEHLNNGIQICIGKEEISFYDYQVVPIDQENGNVMIRKKKVCYPFQFTSLGNWELEQNLSALCIGFQPYEVNLSCSFYDVHGIQQMDAMQIEENWNHNYHKNHLIARIGRNQEGKQIVLDFHEKGNGPHGLIGGMTGSGKSELLITILLSLCMQYSPEDLQIAMIDFKGGGCAKELMEGTHYLPHVVGVLDNLDVSIAERSLISFHQECQRREKYMRLLSKRCNRNINSIDQYRENWRKDYDIPPLAHLILVIDEFAEVRKENPDFMNDLISIARIGRSLGIHLLLSTQKPAGIISDQIWSNCRFKICLKVQDSQDSKEMLHSAVAPTLKNPGEFYLLCDNALQYGMGGYVNQHIGEQGYSFALYQHPNRIQEKRKEKTVERVQVIRAIMKSRNTFQVSPLWKEPLQSVTWSQIEGWGVIGIADDFYHNRYQPVKLKGNTILFANSLQDIDCFLFTSLVALKKDCEETIQIFFLTNSSVILDQLETVSFCNGIIDMEDRNRIRLLNRFVTQSGTEKWILLDDISAFNELDDMRNMLYHWLKYAEKYHVHLLIGCVDSADIRYRELVKFENRMMLSTSHLADASTLLEGKMHHFTKAGQLCMKLDDHIIDVYYPKTSIEDLGVLIPHRSDTYELPKMPAECLLCYEKPDMYRIGVSYENYEPVLLSKHLRLLVVAEQKKNWKFLWNLLKRNPFDVYEGKDAYKVVKEGIVFLTLQEYETTMEGPLLYLGSGYQRQYILKRAIQEDLKWNEGVLYREDICEKIKVVSKDAES